MKTVLSNQKLTIYYSAWFLCANQKPHKCNVVCLHPGTGEAFVGRSTPGLAPTITVHGYGLRAQGKKLNSRGGKESLTVSSPAKKCVFLTAFFALRRLFWEKTESARKHEGEMPDNYWPLPSSRKAPQARHGKKARK